MNGRCELMIVASEPVWPANQGGRVRVAGIASELARHFDICVLAPDRTEPEVETPPVPVRHFQAAPTSRRLQPFLSPRPRLGRTVIDARATSELQEIAGQLKPTVVVYTQSYIAAVAPRLAEHEIVDFPNLERNRLLSIAKSSSGINRASAAFEAAKASMWEQRVARQADLCVAVTSEDHEYLGPRSRAAVLVPNGADVDASIAPSPERGPITFVGTAAYGPNRAAVEAFVRDTWPLIRAHAPAAQLRLVGRDSERVFSWAQSVPGVTVVGTVTHVEPYLAEAALIIAPVTAGGGTQLKVVEALAHGRVVVGTPFSRRSCPPAFEFGYQTGSTPAELASAVVELLAEPERRHQIESRLREVSASTSWARLCEPLVSHLEAALRS